MTIRFRLLAFLLPVQVFFTLFFLALFFYEWDKEITSSYKANLESVLITAAGMMEPADLNALIAEKNKGDLTLSPVYQKLSKKLKELTRTLPISKVFIGQLEPSYGGTTSAQMQEVYLLDTSHPGIKIEKGSEEVVRMLQTKSPQFSPLIHSDDAPFDSMRGIVPLKNEAGEVVAFIGGQLDLKLPHPLFMHADFMMVGTAILTLILSVLALVLIAYKIVEPLNTLKNAALNLAAGEYEEQIDAKGPKEIVELAHTLNTMRECLLDHINRLRENSYLREKIFGEQECAQLLLARMVDDVIEQFSDERVAVKHLVAGMGGVSFGLKAFISSQGNIIQFGLQESDEEGFEGMYQLVSGTGPASKQSKAMIDFDRNEISLEHENAFPPLYWSTSQGKFLPESNHQIHIESKDYLLFFTGASTFIGTHKLLIREAMSKVLRQFALENFELLTAMLTSEINFLLKKANASETIHVFCLKFCNSSQT